MMRVQIEALELIRHLRSVVDGLRRHDPDLASQIQRAASSIVLNLAEGRGRSGRDATRVFRIARGSAFEVEAGLQAAEAWGHSSADAVRPALAAAGNVCRMLCGLVH